MYDPFGTHNHKKNIELPRYISGLTESEFYIMFRIEDAFSDTSVYLNIFKYTNFSSICLIKCAVTYNITSIFN